MAGLERLRREQRRALLDDELGALVALAEATVADIPRPTEPPAELVICPDFRFGDKVVRTRDEAAERFFREHASP